ncbi:DNA polymerase III subunit gamma/tau [Marinobacter xestospongiae]|uniref:DNA polymerase III subunit gamma/tau n=1 Tax=Marinobacter xestospongiae TaxID=994319 RepID=UPI0020055EDF|nr:DNA polymerase III subunit gamma/tau [Marinobacter xestospongiae]MCK7566113.1 DNA polymerase III subunit gamma/tau [Marinobacter xestospongiae]
MSYQVLARKWRPQTFQDMVGQEHVLQALVHALETQRLHHAYLFTGTRGVGKTTIGRLLARCLNCETGITPNPCGECTTCREIMEGRFVDLIEIDAASRTGVDDMRELTDNVQYSPTRGRYKVYLIDEVHMLTNQSFNAFLKTLEEPPEHVKFLLATTDPQKLPVTVLSRCLQFNLKRMTPEHIAGHLNHVLSQEGIPFEEAALWLLARAADGSMRDALSLTDQAIAFGNQKLAASDVSSMLGTIDQRDIEKLVDALVAGDGPGLLSEIQRVSDFAPDYGVILADLLSLFHRVTMEQVVPGSVDNALGDVGKVQSLARQLSAEDAQLFYQSALMGRKDLAVTPDARMGFEMTLLRMLAFRPGVERREPPTIAAQGAPALPENADEPGPAPAPVADAEKAPSSAAESPAAPPEPVSPVSSAPAPSEPAPEPTASPVSEPSRGSEAAPPQPVESSPAVNSMPESAPAEDGPPPASYDDLPPEYLAYSEEPAARNPAPEAVTPPEPVAPAPSVPDAEMAESMPAPPAPTGQPEPTEAVPASDQPEAAGMDSPAPAPAADEFHWPRDFRSLGIVGMPGNLASHAAMSRDGDTVVLTFDEGHARLLNDRHQDRIADALRQFFGDQVQLSVRQGHPGGDTPAAWEQRARQERQQAAEASIQNDPHVRSIVERFEGRVVEDSIKPVS